MSEIDLQGLSWHQGKHIIAFISGANQVSIRDYEDKGLFFFNSIYMFMLPVHMLWMHAVLIISFCADEKEINLIYRTCTAVRGTSPEEMAATTLMTRAATLTVS